MIPTELQQYASAMMAGLVVIGLLFCFLGYRIFRILLVFAGAIIGAGGAMAAAHQQWPGSMVAVVIAAIAGALVGGLLMLVAYYAGVFMAGASFGATIAAVLTGATAQNPHPEPAAVIPAAIVGGILALVLQKLIIILATSFMGSLTAVIGASYFIWGPNAFGDWSGIKIPDNPTNQDLTHAGEEIYKTLAANPHVGIAIVWCLVLGVVGASLQHFVTAKRKKHHHAPTPSPA